MPVCLQCDEQPELFRRGLLAVCEASDGGFQCNECSARIPFAQPHMGASLEDLRKSWAVYITREEMERLSRGSDVQVEERISA